jgi:hypothetical protein
MMFHDADPADRKISSKADISWYDKTFRDKCDKYDVEAIIDGNSTLVIFCAKLLDEGSQKDLLLSVPPTQKYMFKESMKTMTAAAVVFHAARLTGLSMDPAPVFEESKKRPRHVILGLAGEIEKDDPAWEHIQKILEKDKYVESFEIKLNGQALIDWNRKIASELSSRKPAENAITEDDLLNLKISLEASQDVNDFIKQIGGLKGS